jgi:hypothetical protein
MYQGLNLIVKSTMFLHRNIHKFTWTSSEGKTHNQIDNILIDRSSLISSINNSDDDDYLTMYVKFICYIILLTCSISEADASMDLVELQINEMKCLTYLM